MKKFIYFSMALLTGFLQPYLTNAQTFSGTTGIIPDSSTFDFTANVTGLPGTIGANYTISNVTIDISHTWDSDLDISLIGPDGTTMLNLSDDNGDNGFHYTNTVFTDAASINITAGFPPFTGSFKPEGPGTFASVFNGSAANGVWKLRVTDDLNLEEGTLNSWSITFACGQSATATQNMTWTGAVSTDWNNICNWSPSGVPTATNPVTIPDVANDPVILSGVVANCSNIILTGTLTINNGGELNVVPSSGSGIRVNANSTLTNNGTLNASTSNSDALMILNGDNATFDNNGTANLSAPYTVPNVGLLSTNMKINNSATGILNIQGAGNGLAAAANSTGTITNQGIINCTADYLTRLKLNFTFNNSGTIDIKNGSGIAIQGGTVNNLACGKIFTTVYDNQYSSTTTNAGLIVVTGGLYNANGSFTNNGVLKYNATSGNAIINNQNSSVIANNALPIFTYGGTYNGTINGIFTNAAATISAGTFTAPNIFTPSTYPSGTVTYYAKITPSGGACTYIIPFSYTRPTLAVGNVTNPTTCGGTGSIPFTTANVANGTYNLSFSKNGTNSSQNVQVSSNTFTLSGLTAGVYANFSLNVHGSTADINSTKTIASPSVPTLTAGAVTNLTTCGGANGSIAFTSTNLPNGTYSLSFTASAGAASSPKDVTVSGNAFSLNGLKAGTYSNFSITVPGSGCMGSVATSKTLTAPAAPSLTVGVRTNPTTCGGANGSIAFTSTNLPNGVYSLSFTASAGATSSPKDVTVSSDAFSLTNLKSGTYSNFSITVPSTGCVGSVATSKTLNDPATPTLTAGVTTNTGSCGGAFGKIAFTSTNLANGNYSLSFTTTSATPSPKTITVSSNSFNLAGLTAGTYSNFSVAVNGCVGTTNVSKVVADPLTPTIVAGTATNPTSCGGTGSIPFTTTNLANGIYSLEFTETGATATSSPRDVTVSSNAFTLSNLGVGNYTDFSLTRTGCTATSSASINISNPALPTLAAGVKVNPTTCGGTNGSIPFTTNVPNGVYSVSYTGIGSPKDVTVTSGSFTLSNLAAGSYSNFSITHNGCTKTITASRSLTDPNPPVLTLGTASNPTACNLSNGSIPFTSTNITSGTYSFSYTINNIAASKDVTVNSAGAFTLAGLADGVYGNFSIANLAGCTGSLDTDVTLSDLALPVLTVGTASNPTTCGGTNGSIAFTSANLPNGTHSLSFTSTGASSPKDVTISNNTFTINGLSVGNYSNFSVTYLGCTGSVATSKTLSNPASPTITAGATTDPSTCSGADGAIEFTSSNLPNGIHQLSFTTTGVGATTSPKDVTVNNNTFTLEDLKAGTYSAFSVSRNGCIGTFAAAKTLNDPPSPTITAGAVTLPTTCSTADGSIAFTSTNLPDDDYTLNYKRGTVSLSQTVTVLNNAFSLQGLDNGTYNGFSIEYLGCIASHAVNKVITNPAAPTLTAGTATNPTACNSADGKIPFTTTLTDGSYSMTYTGAGSPQDITVTNGAFELTGLTDGTYSNFRIVHSSCTSLASVTKTLIDPTPPTLTAGAQTNPTNCFGNDGTIAFTTNLPNGTYTLNYTGFGSPQDVTVTSGAFTLSNLTAGTYNGFSVINNGCTGIDNSSKTLSDPSAPTVTLMGQANILCNGNATGGFSFSVSGGTVLVRDASNNTVATTGSNPYTVANVAAGTYTINLTNNGCSASQNVILTQPNTPLSILTAKTNVTVNGGNDGTITVTASGGTGSLQFSKDGGTTYTAGTSPYTFNNLTAGTYQLRAKDANGCETPNSEETITQPVATVVLNCPSSTTTTACQTQSAVNNAFSLWLLTASATGGCNGVLSNNNVAQGGAPPACGGSRTVTFTYTSSCPPFTTTCQATFTVPTAPPVTLTCPTNTTTTACQTQAAVDAAFATWLATASGSGGCNGTLTNNSVSLGGAPSACGGSRTVTFIYSSTCGTSTTTCQATFTVPTAPPVTLNCPTNQNEGFGQTQAAINAKFATWLATVSGSGGCNGVLTNNNTGAPLATGGTATVTFTYTSDCAPLTTTCQASFSVSNTPPVVLNCPANATASSPCLTQAQLTAEYNAWLATASGSGGCNGILTHDGGAAPSICSATATVKMVTFTYTSTCAPLTTTCQASFTVPAYPDFPKPTNSGAIRVCLAQTEQPIPPQVNDACGKPIIPTGPTVVDNPNTLNCEGTRTYTYTYTDCAGHSHDWSFVWTLDIPTLAVDPNGTSTVSCPSAPPPTLPTYFADACGRPLTATGPTVTSSPDPVTCEGTKTYTWNLTDCAGNTNTWSWIITIERNDFTLPANGGSTVTCPAAANVVPTPPSKMSECGEPIIPTGPVVSATPDCEGIKTYTWTYTDCEGNSHDWSYIYTIERNDFTVPADGSATVSCPALAVAPTLPTVTSNCGETLTPTGPVVVNTPEPLTCAGTRVYTYTYTDCEGNTHPWSFTYTVSPTLPVTITCPTNTTTNACQTPGQLNTAYSNWLNTASFSGGCGGSLTSTQGVPSICGGSTTLTFTHINACGNQSCQATFTVPTPPPVVLNCPTNQTEAFGQTQAAINAKFATWLATVSGSGGCNGVLTNNNTGAPLATGGTATVTFTYTSGCAPLTTTCQASFSVSNTPPVVLNCPTNATASSPCLTQAQLTAEYNAWLATASGSGGCNGILTHDGGTAPSICSATATVKTVTFTYTSTCAPLTTTCQASFTVPAYPDFPKPTNSGAIRVCLAQTEQPIPPQVTDACGKPIIPTGPTVVDNPNTLNCEGTRTYTYTYTDCAGHSHDWSFVWTLDVPTLAVDPNAVSTVSCPSAPPPVYPNTITDACGRPLTVTGPTVTSSPDPVTCEGTRTYTWNLTDCAGNTNTWSWIINIERNDFTLPANGGSTVTCPAAANVVPTPPSKMSECGEPIIPTGPVVSATPACEGIKTYTWTYTDCEGNSHDWSYIYTIERNDFTVPADGAATVSNLSEITTPTLPMVLSNCGETLIPTGPVIVNNPNPLVCSGTRTYTYTYTDCEGNIHPWSFTYTLSPTIANVSITGLNTAYCKDAAAVTLTGTPTGGTFTIDGNAATTLNPATLSIGNHTVTYDYTDVNGCSNSSSQTVAINALPIAYNVTGTGLYCNGTNGLAIGLSNSELGVAYQLKNGNTNIGTAQNGTNAAINFGNQGVGTYTVVATNILSGCMATMAGSAVISANAAPPTIAVKDITLNLNSAGTGTVTPSQVDNGTTGFCAIASRQLSKTDFNCSNIGVNIVTFTATDINNNSATATAKITVKDVSAPTLSVKDITVNLVNCAASITAAQVNNGSSDNCAITLMNVTPNTFAFANIGSNIVTFTATDAAGNSATTTLTVTVNNVTGSISGHAWKDLDNNGIEGGTGEIGVTGLNVSLYNSDANGNKIGTAISSMTTGVNGIYTFSNVNKGDYVIEIDKTQISAMGMILSRKLNVGGNEATDNDFIFANGLTEKIVLDPCDIAKKNITNVNAGITILGSIGDRFWKDNNNNGVQDNGEAGVAGINLELYLADANGNPTGAAIKTATTTAPNGDYRFEELDNGMYVVKTVLSSIAPTMELSKKKDLGGNDAFDSDFDRFTGLSPKITIVPTDPSQKDILTLDGAIRNKVRGMIGNYVWKDLIENGIQENCEKGVPNITMEIFMKNPQTNVLGKLDTISGVFTPNVPMFTTTTNSAGKYLFSNLEDETWVVKVVKSSIGANMELSPAQNQGGNDAADSDFDAITALSDEVSLDPYIATLRHNLTVDAAIRNTPCDNLKAAAASFENTGNTTTGTLSVANTTVNISVTTNTSQILRTSQDRAATIFADNAYSTKAISGGYLVIKDKRNENGLITLNFNATVSNPILYFKDIVRRKLDLSSSVDVNGNPICMRKISGNTDIQVDGMLMTLQNNDPAQAGSLSEAIHQGDAVVQLIGDFSSINIQSSSLFAAADNWTMGIASEDYNCGSPLTTLPINVKNNITNILPKDPKNPTGNMLVTFEVEISNSTTIKYNNLFIENYLDEKFGTALVGISEAPHIIFPHNSFIIQANPNYNGITDVNLLKPNMNNMMNGGDLIRVRYSIELNPTQLNSLTNKSTAKALNLRFENKIVAGSTSQPIFLSNTSAFNIPVYLPSSIVLPTNPIEDIAGGTVPVYYAMWLQSFGNSMVTPAPQCGKVTWGFDRSPKPYTQNCGNTGIWHTLFIGVDECGNQYHFTADFTSIDKNPPIWDMKPMDKSIVCSSATASQDLAMWLNSAGGAWFSDPGDDKNSKITISSDFVNTNLNCAAGPRVVKFTLTDACGNSTSETAKLSIIDSEAPKFTSVPANITVKCDDTNYTFGTPTATDNCSVVTLTSKDADTGVNCTTGGTKTRIWTASDACGNTATASQTIYFEPKSGTKPVVFTMTNKVSDKIIDCNEAIVFDTPIIESSCAQGSQTSYSYVDTQTAGKCGNNVNYIRKWTFTDKCNNQYNVNQTISVIDNVAPKFKAGLPTSFKMKKNLFNTWKKLYFKNLVTATDNCSAVTLSNPIYKVLSAKSVECTVEASDQCGNTSKYVCIVTFEDVSTTSISSKELASGGDSTSIVPVIDEHNIIATFDINDSNTPEFHKIELYQNRPNPFSQETIISFDLIEANNAILTVFDINGKQVFVSNKTFNKGYNEVILDKSIFPSSGTYFYRLATDKSSVVKKMMFLVE